MLNLFLVFHINTFLCWMCMPIWPIPKAAPRTERTDRPRRKVSAISGLPQNLQADLTAQKDRLYREMQSLREEVAEAETVKRCVETVLTDRAIPQTEQSLQIKSQ